MTAREIATLNSLVTFAAENIPGGLKEREADVAKIVASWLFDGVPVCQVCPHCGTPLLHDEGHRPWFEVHIDNRVHRWWWAAKRKTRQMTRVRRY